LFFCIVAEVTDFFLPDKTVVTHQKNYVTFTDVSAKYMYGFSRFYKYPLSLLILSLWLVAVFLLSDETAHSQHAAISK
jgi:hypothetical protein